VNRCLVIMAALACVALVPTVASAQTDYILQQGTLHVPANASSYDPLSWGATSDSIAVLSWSMPPVAIPGQTVTARVHWKFWTNHSPVCYMNYFGDWQPQTELAQSSMYGGIPGPNEEFVDSFQFVAPATSGWYRIRFMARGNFTPMPSFYGTQDTTPNCYTEVLFHVDYPVMATEEPGSARPHTTSAVRNEPNPFRHATTIRFALPRKTRAAVRIYDGNGRLVKEIANGRLAAGMQCRVWDGTCADGGSAPSGTYVLRVEAGAESVVSQVVRLE
jgi:hypothetical protein